MVRKTKRERFPREGFLSPSRRIMNWVAYWKQKQWIAKQIQSSHDMDISAFPKDSEYMSITVFSLQNWAPLPSCWPSKLSCSAMCFRGFISEAVMTSEEVLGEICKFPETSSAPHTRISQHPGSGLMSLLQLLQWKLTISLKQLLHVDVSRSTFSNPTIVFFLGYFSNTDTSSLWSLLTHLSN